MGSRIIFRYINLLRASFPHLWIFKHCHHRIIFISPPHPNILMHLVGMQTCYLLYGLFIGLADILFVLWQLAVDFAADELTKLTKIRG